MGTRITLESRMTKEILPTNIDITIKAYKVGLDATQVLDDLIKSKDKIQRIITSRSSILGDSYKQSKINFKQHICQHDIYIDTSQYDLSKNYPDNNFDIEKLKTSTFISKEEYDELDPMEQDHFFLTTIERGTEYIAYMIIKMTLWYDPEEGFNKPTLDTLLKDFTVIYNMCMDNDFEINYECTIDKRCLELEKNALLSDCINKGMADMKQIVRGINNMKPDGILLVEVTEHDTKNPDTIEYDADLSNVGTHLRTVVTSELLRDYLFTPITVVRHIDLHFEI